MDNVGGVLKTKNDTADAEAVEQTYDFDLLSLRGEPYYALRRKSDGSRTPVALLVCPIQAQRICNLLSLYQHLVEHDPRAARLIDDGKMIELKDTEDTEVHPTTIALLFGLDP